MFINDTYVTVFKTGTDKNGKHWATFAESKKAEDGKYVTVLSDICYIKKKEVWEAIKEAEDKKNHSFGKASFFLANSYDKEKDKTFYNFYMTKFERYEKKASATAEDDEW